MPRDDGCAVLDILPSRLQSGSELRDDTPDLDIDVRLANWASAWKRRVGGDDGCASLEGNYRSPQRDHWEWNDPAAAPPRGAFFTINHVDAREVELAVCGLDIYHHVLLKGWYIRAWSPPKCLQTARKAAGDEQTRRRGDFELSLVMAKALLGAQLRLPAVVRRTRAVEYARLALGLPLDGLGERPI